VKEFNVSWKESLYFSRIVGHTKILHEENRIFFVRIIRNMQTKDLSINGIFCTNYPETHKHIL